MCDDNNDDGIPVAQAETYPDKINGSNESLVDDVIFHPYYQKSENIEAKKEYEKSFDVKPNQVHDRVYKGNISAKFTNKEQVSEHNGTLVLEGPTLSSTCEFSAIAESDSERILGYIQTGKPVTTRSYARGTLVTELQATLIEKQDEVLDVMKGHEKYKPHFSETGHQNISNEKEIKIEFVDCPISETKLNSRLGRLKYTEWYLQFCIHVVEQSRRNIFEKWKYTTLASFYWFIYAKCSDGFHYQFDYGIIEHECPRELPDFIKNGNHEFLCNYDKFNYSMIPQQNNPFKFSIETWPSSIAKKLANKKSKKIFSIKIEKAIRKRYKRYGR